MLVPRPGVLCPLSVKAWSASIFDFAGQTALSRVLCPAFSRKAASEVRKTDGRGRVPIKLYTWTLNFEFCVTFTCCEIAFFCIFFQPRKNFELMGLTKNQRQDSARGLSLQTPGLEDSLVGSLELVGARVSQAYVGVDVSGYVPVSVPISVGHCSPQRSCRANTWARRWP